jgi:hypothetical protein
MPVSLSSKLRLGTDRNSPQEECQEWIVLDQDGTHQFRVQFPKEGMVTHISDQHIGFRADDHLFAHYTYPD